VTPPTLYLPPRHSEDTRLLWRAATARGWDTLRLQGWRVAPHQHPPGPALVYGEPLFAATVADQLQLALLEPPLDWLANLPRDLLQREVRAGTLAQLLTWPAPAFAKPADDKRFPAAVYDDLANIPGLAHLDPDSPTLWSQPASFTLEVRAFVLDQHTMTASAYARNGALAVEPPAHTPELPHALAFLTAALPAPLPAARGGRRRRPPLHRRLGHHRGQPLLGRGPLRLRPRRRPRRHRPRRAPPRRAHPPGRPLARLTRPPHLTAPCCPT
jgi:hypothetical protein